MRDVTEFFANIWCPFNNGLPTHSMFNTECFFPVDMCQIPLKITLTILLRELAIALWQRPISTGQPVHQARNTRRAGL